MRVTILHNHPIHYKHLLFEAMAAQGVNVDVIFAGRSSSARTAWMQPSGGGYRSHFLWDGGFESLPQVRTAALAVRMAERCCPEVVIVGGYWYLATWSLLGWAKARQLPVALWFESTRLDHPRGKVKEGLKRTFVGWCDVAHVYGRSNREYLEQLGMPHRAIVEKTGPVDTGTFLKRLAAFHEGYRRFIYVGRFSPEKNLPCLLQAFKTVAARRKAELVMVGYGPDEMTLRRQVHALDLDGRVEFAGPKTQDGVSQLLAGADCLVLPSSSEAWGLVINEALCTGVPVLVSDRCGCARDLVTAETGWTFPTGNAEQLAARMLEVCDLTVARLREMGAAAVSLGSEYSPQSCAERIVESLQELLARKDSKAGAPEMSSCCRQ
jgi:glycosyltransferase involved in cell wall biosynthesis